MDLRSLHVIILLNSLTQVEQAQVKPVLSVNPYSPQIFRGQTVTLTCTIPGGSVEYHWYRDKVHVYRSDHYVYSIQIDQSHKFSCYGTTGAHSTTLSNEVTLSVTERPKAVVTLQPDGQIFSGERVTFTCELQGHADTEWTYNFYHNNVQILPYNGNSEYPFTVLESDSGQYTCKGQRKSDSWISESSNSVTLTVSEKPKPVITSDLEGAALTGNSVTLYCTLNLQSALWKFYWKKDKQSHETETETHSYTIRPDSVSDGGQYRCIAGRGNPVYYTHYSDAVWVNVTDPGQNIDRVVVALGVTSPLLFIILLLILLWCCRYKSSTGRNKDTQQHTNLTPDQNPGAVQSQSGHTPHQSDNVPIYATVGKEDKRDAPAEPSGAVYAQVMKRNRPNNNKDQVETNVESEPVYSELK